jgi:hypothetical protein
MIKLLKIIIDERMLSEKIARAKDGDSIELTIVPPQDDGGVHSPAFLHLALIHSGGIYEDMESIDESNITHLYPAQTDFSEAWAQSSLPARPSARRITAQKHAPFHSSVVQARFFRQTSFAPRCQALHHRPLLLPYRRTARLKPSCRRSRAATLLRSFRAASRRAADAVRASE